jgi:uncharacterized membrane protein (DUF4010 family)
MDIADLFWRFGVALGIGLLIGLERGWRGRDEEPGQRTAGIRTFGLTGVLGGAFGALAEILGGPASAGGAILLGLGFAAYSAVFAMFCRDENRADGTFSVTTTVAGMATFVLAAYALLGEIRVAAAVAVATAVLLAMREPLHGWLQHITGAELRAALVLLTMTVIALPLIPDESIGPYGGFNPREVWLIAIVLAGVSFVGYIAVKQFGPRHGMLIGSAAGGLASSTAVTVANARHAAAGEGSPLVLAGGVAAATTISFLRVAAIVVVLRPALLPSIAPPLVAAAVTAATFAVVMIYWRRGDDRTEQVLDIRNPFSFWPVVGFAVLLGAVIMMARAVAEWFGSSGVIGGAILVGFADVDSVTVSTVRLVPSPLSAFDATAAILAAVASNTLSKIAIGAAIGSGRFAWQIAVMAALCIGVGAATLWVGLRLFPGA